MSDEEFARDVLKIAIAQACHQMDFTNIESSAMEVLIDLMQLYFSQIGLGAAYNAELAGRSECNYFDVRRSMDELGVVTIEELIRFNEQASLVPWPRESVVRFAPKPYVSATIRDPVETFPHHVPDFLPPYPDHRAYVQTPLYNQRETDPKTIPKLKLAQRTEAENNLSRLHTREVGQRNIINYDQVYDPRTTHTAHGPFQPAKDPAEIAAANEVEPIRPGPKPTPVPRDRLQHLLDPTGVSRQQIHHDDNGMAVDEATERRIEQIISLEHQGNTLQKVSDQK